MSTRARISFTPASASSGGGGAPTVGSLELGPSFGQSAGDDPSTWNVGVNLDLASIDFANTDSVSAHVTMPAMSLESTDSVSVDISGDIGLDNTDSVSVDISGDLGLENTDSVSVDMSGDLGLENTDSVSSHLSGTVVAAPFYIGSNQGTTNGVPAASLPINVPTGVQDGDLLIAFLGLGGGTNAAFTTPGTWTELFTPINTGTASVGMSVLYRIASSEPASYTFAQTGTVGATDTAGEIHCIRGVNASPIDAHAEATGTTADPDPPSITTVAANCFVFAWSIHSHAAVAETNTAPGSYVERRDFNSGSAAGKIGSSSATRYKAVAGSENPAVFNCSQTVALVWRTCTVSIAPGTLTIAT